MIALTGIAAAWFALPAPARHHAAAARLPAARRARLPRAQVVLRRALRRRRSCGPAAAFGRFGRTVIESVFVQDVIVGGSVAVVRAGSSFARGLQTGYLRSYAVLLVTGLAGLALYFLITAS